jgi:hypothetical protein
MQESTLNSAQNKRNQIFLLTSEDRDGQTLTKLFYTSPGFIDDSRRFTLFNFFLLLLI